MIDMLPYAPWVCWLVPFFGAVLTPIFAKISPNLRNYAPTVLITTSTIFAFSMIQDVSIGVARSYPSGEILGSIPLHWSVPWINSPRIDLAVVVDPLSVLAISLVNGIALLVFVFSLEYMRGDPGLTRYWFLAQLFVGGLGMVVMAGNLLQLYIGWEIAGVSSYGLVSYWYRKPENCRHGLKTFLILRVGDVFLLASILMMYSCSNTFDFNGLHIERLSKQGLLLVTSLMFLTGALSKSAQFPLQIWLADAMPSTPASFNAITKVLAGVFLVARMFPIFHSALARGCVEITFLFLTITWVGALTALLGASLAAVQKNIVRVLAYSIMSQYAYMMVGLGVGGLMADPAPGYLASTLHLMVDAIVSGLLLLCVAAILHRVRSQDMFDIGKFRVKMPITFTCMIIGSFATIGVPPLSGFWSEEAIYGSILELAKESGGEGMYVMMLSSYLLFLLMMATAAITAFYVVRMMGIVFGRKRGDKESPRAGGKLAEEVSTIMWVPMVVAAAATVVIGVLAPYTIVGFQGFFGPILNSQAVHDNIFDVLNQAFLSPSFAMTCAVLAIGGYPAYKMYVAGRAERGRLTIRYRFVQSTYGFLLHRCFIDSIYYHVAQATKSLFKLLFRYVEIESIDAFNYLTAGSVIRASHESRRIQTGILSWNMFFFALGISLMALLLLLFR